MQDGHDSRSDLNRIAIEVSGESYDDLLARARHMIQTNYPGRMRAARLWGGFALGFGAAAPMSAAPAGVGLAVAAVGAILLWLGER